MRTFGLGYYRRLRPLPGGGAGLEHPLRPPQAETQICDTGRGYLVYSFYSSAIYYSEDGATWTDLSDRSWAKEAAAYTYLGVGGLGHRELEVLWTGSEYMMRQSMLDDPRLTHQRYGDSPRNNFVTFLDEGFQVIGEQSFNGPVTAIRYGDGTYYATVNGETVAFSHADWAADVPEDDAPTELQTQTVIAARLLRATQLFRALLQVVVSSRSPS